MSTEPEEGQSRWFTPSLNEGSARYRSLPPMQEHNQKQTSDSSDGQPKIPPRWSLNVSRFREAKCRERKLTFRNVRFSKIELISKLSVILQARDLTYDNKAFEDRETVSAVLVFESPRVGSFGNSVSGTCPFGIHFISVDDPIAIGIERN